VESLPEFSQLVRILRVNQTLSSLEIYSKESTSISDIQSEDFFKALAGNTGLVHLHLQNLMFENYSPLGDALATNKFLRRLDIVLCGFRNREEGFLNGLQHNKTLKSLKFTGGFLEPDLVTVGTVLEINDTVERLDLAFQTEEAQVMIRMMPGLIANKAIKELVIRRFLEDANSMRSFFRFNLPTNDHLKMLDLSSVQMNSECKEALFESLNSNKCLEHLLMSFCDQDMLLLCKALEKNRSISRLEIEGNEFEVQTRQKFLPRLFTLNIGLEEVKLGGNKIDDHDCTFLVEAFKRNSTLRSVWLNKCPITGTSMELFNSLAFDNKSMCELNFGWNDKLDFSWLNPWLGENRKRFHELIVFPLLRWAQVQSKLKNIDGVFERNSVGIILEMYGNHEWYECNGTLWKYDVVPNASNNVVSSQPSFQLPANYYDTSSDDESFDHFAWVHGALINTTRSVNRFRLLLYLPISHEIHCPNRGSTIDWRRLIELNARLFGFVSQSEKFLREESTKRSASQLEATVSSSTGSLLWSSPIKSCMVPFCTNEVLVTHSTGLFPLTPLPRNDPPHIPGCSVPIVACHQAPLPFRAQPPPLGPFFCGQVQARADGPTFVPTMYS
jgi:hypothetical protein